MTVRAPSFVRALLTSAVLASGCVSNLTLPGDAKIVCATDADCPNSLICNAGRICVPSSYKDQPPPDLQAIPAATPAIGGVGQDFAITVLSTEPLRNGPTVVLHLTPLRTITGCTQNTADRLNYTCHYTAAGDENGGQGGVVPFDVQLENDLRVTTLKTFAGSLTFDFAAPTVVTHVFSATASIGETATIDLLFSEPLAAAPVVTITDSDSMPSPLTFDVTAVSDREYLLTHLVTGDEPQGSIQVSVKGTDLAGNTSGDLDGGSVFIASTPPAIKRVWIDTSINSGGIDSNTFSATPGFNVVRINVTTTQAFEDFNVSIGGRLIPRDACTGYQTPTADDQPNYSCLYTVTPDLIGQDTITPLTQVPNEVEPIVVWATDSAGNRALPASPLSVIFDLSPPAIGPASTSVTISPPAGSAIAHPTSVTVGSSVTLEFTASEKLRIDPGVTTEPSLLVFQQTAKSGNRYQYAATLTQRTTDRTYQIHTTLTDVAGNQTDINPILTLPAGETTAAPLTIDVDTTAPLAPSAGTGVVYTRAPWGRQDGSTPTSSPLFTVSGAINSGESSTAGHALWVRVYDGPDRTTATRIQQTETLVDATTGSFPEVPLTPVDRSTVYVGFEDEAGNSSPTIQVKNVKWIGSLSGSISTELPTNPTLLLASPNFASSVDPEPFQASEVASGQTTFTATGRGIWRAAALGAISPSARSGASLAFDLRRGVAVLTGGDDATGPQSDTWEWDGSTWTRRSVSSPPARSHAAMAYNARLGVSVLFGGWAGGEMSDTWTYDGVRWKQWRAASGAAVPDPRRDATLTYNPVTGTVVLFGGRAGNTPLADAWIFDGAKWTKLTPSVLPSPRSRHSLTYQPAAGKFVLYGGLAANGQDLQDTWELTPSPSGTDWTWAQITAAAAAGAREQHSAYYDPTLGNVVAVGGRNNAGTALADTWKWTGSQWSQISGATLSPGRFASALAYDASHAEAVLFGGSTASTALAETWAFNSTKWVEATPSAPPAAQQGVAVAFHETRGLTVLFGGATGTGTAQGSTWVWNGRRWSQPTLTTQPPARTNAALGYDRNRAVLVLFGGIDGNGQTLADTWEWDGNSAAGWTQRSPAHVPPARSSAMLGFWCGRQGSSANCDPATAVALLAGGTNAIGSSLRDTWQWNGTDWASASPLPEGRTRSAIAYDPARFTTVVFGGLGGTSSLADTRTLEWNGSVWNLKGILNAPVPRAGHVMGYDSGRGRVVVFGGVDANGLPLNDDWTWDGSSWTQGLKFCVTGLPQQGLCDANGTPVSVVPAGRSLAGGAFDTIRNRLVVFGGSGLGSVLGDTWELSNDPNTAPAALVTFDFTAVTGTSATLQTPWAPWATIGGLGNTVTIPGTGTPAFGSRLFVWDAWLGSWVQVGSNASPASSPSIITPVNTLPAPSHIIGTDGLIHFAVVPSSGQGNGAPAQASIKDVQLTMSYKLP